RMRRNNSNHVPPA
ncbi:hypothetical protein EsHS_00000701, partial [Epichloe bromicola]